MSASWEGRVAEVEADAQTGHYYVTARNEAGRTAFLLGPFTQKTLGNQAHCRALSQMRRARRHVMDNYPRSMGWTFGTSRLPLNGNTPAGKLNDVIGLYGYSLKVAS